MATDYFVSFGKYLGRILVSQIRLVINLFVKCPKYNSSVNIKSYS